MADDSTSAMARTTVNGALYLGVSQAVKLVLTTLSTVVISRLLTPDAYGVIAMVAPVMAFIVMFQDLGLSAATIQRKEIDHSLVNSLFWLNVLASMALATMLVAVAPLVGWFYGDVRAGWVTAATSLTLLVTGSALQHSATLNRDLRFAALSAADLINASVTFVVSALAAWLMRSFWALYLGMLAGAVAQTITLWMLAPWRPNWSMGLRHARQVAAFGSHVTGFNLVNYVVRNADTLLIARTSGAGVLGLYDRSYKLMMMPVQSINVPLSRLLLPVMSRLQDDPERYRRTFAFTIRLLMMAIAPGVAIGVVLSDRVIPFLLGAQWSGAAPIFFWLGLTGLVQPIANMTGVLFVSSGRTALQLRWGLFSAVVTLIGFVVALPWGAAAVAASLFFTMLGRIPILFWLCATPNGVRQRDLYGAQIEPLVGAGLGAAAAWAMAPTFETGPLLCLAVPVAYLTTGVMTLATREGRATLIRADSIARGLLVGLSRRIASGVRRLRPS